MGYMGYFTLSIKTVSWYISFNNFPYYLVIWGFQDGSMESACQYRRHRFDSWIGKISKRRKWQLTEVFLPGRSHREEPEATVHGVTVGHCLTTEQILHGGW